MLKLYKLRIFDSDIIFWKIFQFHEPFVNFSFIGLDTIFYFRSLLKVAKKQIPGIFIASYVYIVLRQEIH